MDLQKLRKRIKWISVVAAVISLIFILLNIVTYINLISANDIGRAIMSCILSIIGLLIMGNVILILRDIASGETPFKRANIHRLQIVSFALMAFEPVNILQQLIVNHYFIRVSDGIAISSMYSFGGLIFLVGLAVFGISLMFQYGTELQRQSDETL